MGFWQNVESELQYQGISRKELALNAKISYSGIGLGLERDSMPGADTALRVSKVLNVSIEYLLTGNEAVYEQITPISSSITKRAGGQEIDRKKYRALIDDLEKLPEKIKEPICQMIHRIAFCGESPVKDE